jgi:hypothetical protein
MCFSHAEAQGALSTRLNKRIAAAKGLTMDRHARKSNLRTLEALAMQGLVRVPSHWDRWRPLRKSPLATAASCSPLKQEAHGAPEKFGISYC